MNSKLKWLIGTWLLIQAIAVHAQTYTAIELPFAVGLSDGSDTMGGTPINNAGQVVGFSFTQSGTVGYLYSNGVTTALANDFIPNAINNSGEIAGTSSTPGVVTVAAVYNNGALTSIGTLGSEPGYPPSNVPVNESYGVSLNDGGQVVGRSTAPGGGEPPFLYSNGSMTAPNIGPGAQAAGINNGGTIVGSFIPSPAQNDLFHAYVYVNGSVTDLGTLGGAQSFGNAINNAGQVTGTAQTASGQLDAFLSSNGQMKDLGSLNGSGSIGYGINNLGQVVGTSNVDGNSLDSEATLWNGTGMINLNSLVTNQIPTTLNQAIGINDNGWIVADGGSNGSSIEAYLLVPNSVATAAPEIDPGMAGTALTLLAGFAAIMGGRRRPGRR